MVPASTSASATASSALRGCGRYTHHYGENRERRARIKFHNDPHSMPAGRPLRSGFCNQCEYQSDNDDGQYHADPDSRLEDAANDFAAR